MTGRERPTQHITPHAGWMNDPNGLIYHDGVYHLFFHHNPFGVDWGNMSWGHAISADLLHWEELDVAIPCDEQEAVFSGSVVYDAENTSGLGSSGGALIALYTSAFTDASPYAGQQAQSLAYSADGGRTWTKRTGGPIVSRNSGDFRDTKVFRYDRGASSHWVMVAVEAPERREVVYTTEDLLDWTYRSASVPSGSVGGRWECPDLFPLTVDGRPDAVRWVLLVSVNDGAPNGGSGTQYFLGDFDGQRFRAAAEGAPRWLDYGRDCYAATTFNDPPEGRRILIAWMSNWQYAAELPATSRRGSMTCPRELNLESDGTGIPRLVQRFVPELNLAHTTPGQQVTERLIHGRPWTVTDLGEAASIIELSLRAGSDARLRITLGRSGPLVHYDAQQELLSVDRAPSPTTSCSIPPEFRSIDSASLELPAGVLHLRLLIDRGSLELQAGNGIVFLSELIVGDSLSGPMAIELLHGSADVEACWWDLSV